MVGDGKKKIKDDIDYTSTAPTDDNEGESN